MFRHIITFVLALILIINQIDCAPIGSETDAQLVEVENSKRQVYPINQQPNPFNNRMEPNYGQMQQNFVPNQQNFVPNQQNFAPNQQNMLPNQQNIQVQNQQAPYWQTNSQNPNNLNLIHNNQYWPGPDPQSQQQHLNNQNQQQAKAYVYPLKPVFPEFVTTTTTTTTTEHGPETASQNPDDVPLYSKSFNPYDRETVRATPLTPQALWYSRYADLTVPIAAVPFNTWNNI